MKHTLANWAPSIWSVLTLEFSHKFQLVYEDQDIIMQLDDSKPIV